jgi:hypothetical protein
MDRTFQDILDAAIALSDSDRVKLIERLLESTGETSQGLCLDDKNLIAELDRRFHDRAGAIEWEDLRAGK